MKKTYVATVPNHIGAFLSASRLLAALESEDMVVSLVFNTYLQGNDLLAAVLRDFGLSPEASAADNIDRLNRFRYKKPCHIYLETLWPRRKTVGSGLPDGDNKA